MEFQYCGCLKNNRILTASAGMPVWMGDVSQGPSLDEEPQFSLGMSCWESIQSQVATCLGHMSNTRPTQ